MRYSATSDHLTPAGRVILVIVATIIGLLLAGLF
jgi:hypothetical protein